MGFFSKDSPALKADRTDWETPRDLFDRLDAIWHFDLDAASSDDNALCSDHFTVEQDGLRQPWGGRRVWCNPPYGRQIADWVEKAYHEAHENGAIVVMLVPARTDTRWYHDYVAKADEVAFIRGRLRYTLGGGQAEQRSIPVDARQVWRSASRKGRVMGGDKSCEFCDHCLYIGDGDFWCEESKEIIASGFAIHEAQVCEKYEEGE